MTVAAIANLTRLDFSRDSVTGSGGHGRWTFIFRPNNPEGNLADQQEDRQCDRQYLYHLAVLGEASGSADAGADLLGLLLQQRQVLAHQGVEVDPGGIGTDVDRTEQPAVGIEDRHGH